MYGEVYADVSSMGQKIFFISVRIVPDHFNQAPQYFYYLPQNRCCPEHFISALKVFVC